MDYIEELTVSEELAAKAIGRFVMKTVNAFYGKDALEVPVKSKAEEALQEIKNAMNNQELNDFYCIDEIVEILERYGIDTYRHDFG